MHHTRKRSNSALKQSNCSSIIPPIAIVSPKTPITTSKPKLEAIASLNNTKPTKYSARATVYNQTGCIVDSKISKTLQGSVYIGHDSFNNKVIIKRTDKKLHRNHVAYINGKFVKCTENIIKEASLMQKITNKNPPNGFIKYIDFISDEKNYFLIMEYGGESLFKYVKNMHELIKNGKLSLIEWKKHCKIIFKQMCECIYWLHINMRHAHMDISLENITIKNYKIIDGKFVNHGQIYFIDFGLCKSFVNKLSFDNCKHFVGKKLYQAPKIVQLIPFNASKADIWCLGVCLFMLSLGVAPFNEPKFNDPHFSNIMNGYLSRMLIDLKRLNYVSNELLSLLNNILCYENKRITIEKLLDDEYFH